MSVEHNFTKLDREKLDLSTAIKICKNNYMAHRVGKIVDEVIDEIQGGDNEIVFILLERDFEKYKILVESGKIIPDVEQLNYVISNVYILDKLTNMVIYMIEHKVIPNHECFDNIVKLRSRIILNILIEGGLTIGKSDLLILIDKQLEIMKFDKLGIPIDDEIFHFCIDKHYFPLYFNNYLLSIEQIRELFSRIKIKNIPKHVCQHMTSVDLICLENACKLKGNIKSVKYILKRLEQFPSNLSDILQDYGNNKYVVKILKNKIYNC
jgi:hypothetical protein